MSLINRGAPLKTSDLCRILGFSADKIQKLCQQKRIKHLKIDDDYRFFEKDVEEFIAEHFHDLAPETVQPPKPEVVRVRRPKTEKAA